MPYRLDYSDQVRFGLKEHDADDYGEPEPGTRCFEPQQCPRCGAWGFDANDPHEPGCPLFREPDTELPF